MLFTRTSIISQTTTTLDIPVTAQQLNAYDNGALVQNAFPDLAKELREFIVTGITPGEWAKTFGSDSENNESGSII